MYNMQQIRRCSFAYGVIIPSRSSFCHNLKSSSGTPTPTSSRRALTGLHTPVDLRRKCAITVLVIELKLYITQGSEKATFNACACPCIYLVHCDERHGTPNFSSAKATNQHTLITKPNVSGIAPLWMSHVIALK